uniref:Steroid 5 alpha-reductase 2 n=1 Tax=Monodelphis domestica TaxID=13616 RepID=A0A5F8H4I7_MONDO
MPTVCLLNPVLAGSALLAGLGLLKLLSSSPDAYGKQAERLLPLATRLPARAAWFLQELPSFVVPIGLLAWQPHPLFGPPGTLLLGLFCGHYFHRYPPPALGSPFPLTITFLLPLILFYFNCAEYPDDWVHRMSTPNFYISILYFLYLGILLFFLGMAINIHSDYLLRQLRKPGEISYKIPQGGLFTYISGANYFGEIVEWIGYAMATWSFPGLAFAFFSSCFLGKRGNVLFYTTSFPKFSKCTHLVCEV